MTPFERSFSKLSENDKTFLHWIHRIQVMAAERVSEPKRGVLVVEHLSTAIRLVSLVQCQNFYHFLKA